MGMKKNYCAFIFIARSITIMNEEKKNANILDHAELK